VVGEARVHVSELRDLPDRRDVRLDVALELLLAQLVEGLDLEALVSVVDVDRQQAADVRAVHGAAAPEGGATDAVDLEPAGVPLADRVHEAELARPALLAEEVDVVAEPHERLRELRVVDVRPGPAQQVAVEDQQAHAASLGGRAGEIALRRAASGGNA
jgi:hypothetical protein